VEDVEYRRRRRRKPLFPPDNSTSHPDMPAVFSSAYVAPILLLIASNVFMTLAWYGHLRYKQARHRNAY
jgi:putative drug/metabolite transporter DUF486